MQACRHSPSTTNIQGKQNTLKEVGVDIFQ